MPLNDVPQSGQTLANTQAPIRSNFSVIGTAFITDHVDYNAVGQGKHNKVTFPVQSPAPAFAAGELGLYNAAYVTTGQNELFVKKAAGTGYPMTAAGLGTPGWTLLPSGILMKFGQSSGMTISINLNGIGPAFGDVYNAQISNQGPLGSAGAGSITALSTTTLNISSSTSNFKYWFVIGRL